MTRTDTLELAVWNAESVPQGALTVTRFKLSHDAHDALAQWSRERTKRHREEPVTVILRGLSEIMAWFVPEVAFLRHERDPAAWGKRLCLYFVGDVTQSQDLHHRIQAALGLWLGVLYPDKPVDVRTRIAAAALVLESWSLFDVGSELKNHSGVCALPEDSMMWDALAARAVAALAGEVLRFRSGERRLLVAKTSQSSAYEGLELVAFPPKRSPNSSGLWSEVLAVHTPTYPERSTLHVMVRPSIRNWGPVTRWASGNDPNRSLDVFLPSQGNGDATVYKHTSFRYKPTQDKTAPIGPNGRPPLVASWAHKEDYRIFSLIRRLSGIPATEPSDHPEPITNHDGLWVLPRLGTVHGDDRMAGGSGLPWPDRQDIADSIDSVFHGIVDRIGLKRANSMVRVSTRMPLAGPFNSKTSHSATDYPRRRQAVLDALRAANNNTGELAFYVFHLLDRTPQTVLDALIEYLGEPASMQDMRLQWTEGLSIRVIAAPAGVLSELLPWIELSDAEKQGRTRKQQEEMIKANRHEALSAVLTQMRSHVERARAGVTSVACALLEMPQTFKGNRWRDPFHFSRRSLARCSVLPQVVLVASQGTDPAGDASRYGAAVRDCFRMLGTLPVGGDQQGYAPAAMTVIQRNADMVAGSSRRAHAFPLAARIRDDRLECAIPEETGDPVWLPYSEAALFILSGDYGKLGRGRWDENIAKFNAFFTTVLEDIDRFGPALVIAEGESLGHKLATLQNGKLEFDRLAVSNRTYTPSDLPNLCLVRVSPDPTKQPYYYHHTDSKWPTGLFAWDDGQRTFYALKAKPPSVSSRQHFAAQTSRHQVFGDNENPPRDDVARVSPQIDEICVSFMQPSDDPQRLATLVHRLRGVHAQYRYDTSLPFPLHELRLLGGGVTL